MKTCCFTGHRPKGLPWGTNENLEEAIVFKQNLENEIIKAIQKGIDTFITGMAQGVDLIAGEIIIKLKKKYTLNLVAAIPCKEQTLNWSFKDIQRYENILKSCDKVVYVSQSYNKDCMLKRNRYMVDNSNLLIACWNGKPSGTSYTINYAKKKNIEVVILRP